MYPEDRAILQPNTQWILEADIRQRDEALSNGIGAGPFPTKPIGVSISARLGEPNATSSPQRRERFPRRNEPEGREPACGRGQQCRDDHRRAVYFADDASEISEEIGAKVGLDQRTSALRGEDWSRIIAGRAGHCFLRPSEASVFFRGLPNGLRRGLLSFAASRLPRRGSPHSLIDRHVAVACPSNHLPQNAASNAVMDVTRPQLLGSQRDQIGKLMHFSNSPLRFSAFICYKQSTESRSVAAGRSLFESLVSVRHLSIQRV
jgi:hypothetical protein